MATGSVTIYDRTSSSKSTPPKKKYFNWTLSHLASMYTRNGLKNFAFQEISDFRDNIYKLSLAKLQLNEGTTCSDCTTKAIVYNECELCRVKPCRHILCPKNGLCNEIKRRIIKSHVYKTPLWKNTDARKWCEGDPWQIAKCYMPDGYVGKETVDETDLNGVLSVILNHKNIAAKLRETGRDGTKLYTRKRSSSESSIEEMQDNIFRQARMCTNRMRHEPNLELDDDELEQILNVFREVLEVNEIAKNKEGNEAKQNILTLRQYSKESYIPEEIENELMPLVKQLEAESITDLHLVLKKIDFIFEKYNQKGKRLEMCQQLREYYEKECSTLPISALFEDEDAPLLSFYVKPTMRQVNYHRVSKHNVYVNSYADLFYKDKEPVQNIYITGDAGIGKTAVCQRMVLCWCHAKNEGTQNENFSKEDIDTMKSFDFLFFVSLRETYFCDVTKIIQEQLTTVAKPEDIEKVLNEENCLIVLDGLDEWTHQQFCCRRHKNKIPDRKIGKKLTYITTTRPWKIETERLKSSEIDQQITLKGLDQKTSEALTSYVIQTLNKTYNAQKDVQNFTESFERQKHLKNISYIPIIKIQLISLWFNDIQRSNFSRCAIYHDTIQMLFERAIAKYKKQDSEQKVIADVKNVKEEEIKEHETLDFLTKGGTLSEFQTFLFKLGYLAFSLLFKVPTEKKTGKKESALVFDSEVTKEFGLRDVEMQFALFVGVLSTNKAIGPRNLRERLKKLTFLHKSYQEYFAALYITTKKDQGGKLEDIFSKFGSIAEVLKYENFFVFLSGLKLEVMTMISNGIRKIVSSDKNVQSYRRSAHYKFGLVVMLKPYHNLQSDILMEEENGRGALRALQTLLLQCLDEGISADRRPFDIPLSDVFIDKENCSKMSNIIRATCQHLKSVSTELSCPELKLLNSLEKLVIMESTYSVRHNNFKEYETCISLSKSSLVSLSIANCTSVRVVNDLERLTSLALFDIIVTHQELIDMFGFITKTVALTQLFLCTIKCSDHGKYCKGSILDLRKHFDLKYLRLQDLYDHGSHMTRLNNTKIELLVFQAGTNETAVRKVMEDIKNAPKLKEIVLINFKTKDLIDNILDVVPTLTCLERLSFFSVYFGESLLALNADKQKSINTVTCFDISLTLESLCKFVTTLPKEGVVVHILSSKINCCQEESAGEKDMRDAARYVAENTTFKITNSDKFRLSFDSE